MYIDRTDDFFELVREAKSHLSPGTPKASTDNQLFDEEEDQSLATIREFHTLSKRVLNGIMRMTDLLDDKFGAYVALARDSFFVLDTPRLSMAEKEEVDSIVEDFCKVSNLQLKEITILANSCSKQKSITSTQVKHSKELVSFLTRNYKQIVKKIHNMKKSYAAELRKQDEPLCPDDLPTNMMSPVGQLCGESDEKKENNSVGFLGAASMVASIGNVTAQGESKSMDIRPVEVSSNNIMKADDIENIDDENFKSRIEQENKQMMAEFENDFEEARKMETKMMEIAEMTQIFGSAVKEQHEMIERIGDDVDNSVENVVRGNKQLIKAEENTGTGSRFLVYVLLILSFVLLFLDYFS